MDADIYAKASQLRAGGTPFVLATVVASYTPQSVRPGAKAIVHADGTLDGWVGGGCVRPVILQEAAEALADGRPRLVRMNAGNATAPARHGDVREYPMTCQGEGGVEVYLEPVLATPRLVVLGNTPVAQSLARLGLELGFETIVASTGGSAGLFPPGARVAPEASAALAGADTATAVVVATMGAGDEEALAAAARSEAGYVGLVASRKKARQLLEFVRATGVPIERLARVKYPAGLDLGGMTASEIAVSIAAEIVQRRYAARPGEQAVATGESPLAAETARRPRALAVAPLPLDPVCGMPVDPATATHTLAIGEETIYFCCPHCKARYERSQRESGASV
jgi:xanthine dehydrogenase accessory factor